MKFRAEPIIGPGAERLPRLYSIIKQLCNVLVVPRDAEQKIASGFAITPPYSLMILITLLEPRGVGGKGKREAKGIVGGLVIQVMIRVFCRSKVQGACGICLEPGYV
ncbi:hypothetical protein JTB14_016611 [Gonioctena quinquepunctata]|nr:hypothetical protein JTB14_016611 [Gonioctena quinquepunctata]